MFCPQCGKEFAEKVNYCCQCGSAMSGARVPQKKLALSRTNKKIAGVCAGFAEYLDLDPTLVRLVWVMMALFVGWGVISYIVAWIVLPEPPEFHASSAVAPLPVLDAARSQ